MKKQKNLFLYLNILPESLSTLTNLIAVLIKLDKLEKAEKLLKKAIKLHPNDEALILNQRLFLEKNNSELALASYQKAIELKHD